MIGTGMLFGRLVKLIKLPNVTGYLLAGLVLGPNILGLLSETTVTSLGIISEAALGFIAFSIGGQFKFSYFKRVGAAPIVIATFESLFAVLFVAIALIVCGSEIPFAIGLASIAAATAPAATIMVINQYKAKGKVTETLLSVVAIDDATALIMFGISTAVVQAMTNPDGLSAKTLLSPLWEIGGALVVGIILGILFNFPLRWFKKDGNRLSITIGFIFIGIGIADAFGFSSLLLCMALGAALTNTSSQTKHIMKLSESITPPIFLIFFVLSGAELQLSVIPSVGLVGILYIIFRVIGKMVGSYTGAAICRSDDKVKKWLGPALVPQAGVAIGLSLAAATVLPEYATQIRTVILCATMIYELVGPAAAKFALKRAGEIEEG